MSLQVDTTADIQISTLLGSHRQMDVSANRPEPPTTEQLHAVIMLAHRFDTETMALRLAGSSYLNLQLATTDLLAGLTHIERHKPNIALLDPSIHPECIHRLEPLVREGLTENLVILDNRTREGLLVKVLQMPRTSYFTRQIAPDELREALESIAKTSERMFDAEIESRIVRSPKGTTLLPNGDRPPLTLLTRREMEVLKLISSGIAVRECAARLNVAISTIDNHKSRIMRKLQVQKTSQLIHLAIREGIVLV